ncbi:MAG: hypothetical protein ACOYBY_09260 [Dermatophilaceae bacterium]
MSHATSHATSHARPARQPRRATRRGPLHVVPKAIERSGNGVFAVLCMALLAGGLVVLLLLNTALAQGAFTLQSLTVTSGSLTDDAHGLRQSIDAQSNSAALAQRAVQLGMVPAKSMAFVRLSDGAIIGVAEPAKPQPLVVVTTPRPAPTPEPTATATADPDAPVDTVAPAATAAPAAPASATAAPATPAAAATAAPGAHP